PSRTARLSEQDVLSSLRQNLDWNECPKVVLMGDRRDITPNPIRAEYAARFKQFFQRDFSLGGF
ncbi:MAG: hypothetical protein D6719_09280, partial [Candidatus Dadabacteria bacterium]